MYYLFCIWRAFCKWLAKRRGKYYKSIDCILQELWSCWCSSQAEKVNFTSLSMFSGMETDKQNLAQPETQIHYNKTMVFPMPYADLKLHPVTEIVQKSSLKHHTNIVQWARCTKPEMQSILRIQLWCSLCRFCSSVTLHLGLDNGLPLQLFKPFQ